jgi:peptidoglycan/LPS O-acetylase OafA/YrhL
VTVRFLFPGAELLIKWGPRSWPDILRAASTNYFALFGLVILIVAVGLLVRTKGWPRAAGVVALVAGVVLLVRVLSDIKAEIPSRRDIDQRPTSSEH